MKLIKFWTLCSLTAMNIEPIMTQIGTEWGCMLTKLIEKHNYKKIIIFTDDEDSKWQNLVKNILVFVDGHFYVKPWLEWRLGLHSSQENIRMLFILPMYTEQHIMWFQESNSGSSAIEIPTLIIGDDLKELLPTINLSYQNHIMIPEETETDILLWGVYQHDKGSKKTVWNEIGKWTPHSSEIGSKICNGTFQFYNPDLIASRNNLQGHDFRCVTIQGPPYSFLVEKPSGQKFDGLAFDVWNLLANLMNFTYTCHFIEDGEYGLFVNGKWTGMVGEVSSYNSDAAVAAIDLTADRSAVVQFITAIGKDWHYVITSSFNNEDHLWTKYTTHMTNKAWGVFGAILILLVLVMYLISKVRGNDVLSYIDCFIIIIGSFCSSGNSFQHNSCSQRIVLLTSYVFTFLVLTHYTSFLISTLTSSIPYRPFSTLEGLLRHSSCMLGFTAGVSVGETLKNSDVSLFQDAWERIEQLGVDNIPATDEDGMFRATQSCYGHIISKNIFEYNFLYNCALEPLPHKYLTVNYGIALQKNSTYRRTFNYQMLKLYETGVLKKLIQNREVASRDCSSRNSNEPISLETVSSAFLLLLIGIIISLVILSVENTHYKYFNKSIMTESKFE